MLEDEKLLKFLRKQGSIIFDISKPAWNEYRRAGSLAASDLEGNVKHLIKQKQKLEEELAKFERENEKRTQLTYLKQDMPNLSDKDVIRKMNEVKQAIYNIKNTIKKRESLKISVR